MFGVNKISQSGIHEAVTKGEVAQCFENREEHEHNDELIFGTKCEQGAERVRDAIVRRVNNGATIDKIVDVRVFEFS